MPIFLKYLFVSFILLAFLNLPFHLYKEIYTSPETLAKTDFGHYLTSVQLLKKGTLRNIYQPLYFSAQYAEITKPYNPPHLLFRSLPFTSFFFLPIFHQTLIFSYSVYLFWSLLLILIINLSLKKLFPTLTRLPFWFLLITSFLPTTISLLEGQTSLLLFLFLLSSFVFILKQRFFFAGLFLTLLLIKIHFFVTSAIFLTLLIKNRKFMFGILLGTIFLVSLNWLLLGDIKLLIQYPKYLLTTETSLLGSHSSTYYNLPLFLILPILALLYLTSHRYLKAKFAAICLFIPLFSLHTPLYDLIFLIFPVIFLINQKSLFKNLLALCLFLLPFTHWQSWNPTFTSYFILLVGLILFFSTEPIQIPKPSQPPQILTL